MFNPIDMSLLHEVTFDFQWHQYTSTTSNHNSLISITPYWYSFILSLCRVECFTIKYNEVSYSFQINSWDTFN